MSILERGFPPGGGLTGKETPRRSLAAATITRDGGTGNFRSRRADTGTPMVPDGLQRTRTRLITGGAGRKCSSPVCLAVRST